MIMIYREDIMYKICPPTKTFNLFVCFLALSLQIRRVRVNAVFQRKIDVKSFFKLNKFHKYEDQNPIDIFLI